MSGESGEGGPGGGGEVMDFQNRIKRFQQQDQQFNQQQVSSYDENETCCPFFALLDLDRLGGTKREV